MLTDTTEMVGTPAMTGCRLALTLEACAGQSQRTNDCTMMCRSLSWVAVSCALLCFGAHCPYLGSCGCWHSSPLCDCKTQAPSSGWLSSGATVNCREAAVVPCQVPCPIGAVFLSAPSFRKGQPLRSYLMRSDLARVPVWAAARFQRLGGFSRNVFSHRSESRKSEIRVPT